MLSEMTTKDLAEWDAFYQIEPFGEYQTNYAAGVIASTLANINKGKNTKAFSPEDFIPKRKLVGAAPKKQSLEQLAVTLRQIASTNKGKSKKKKHKKKKRKK